MSVPIAERNAFVRHAAAIMTRLADSERWLLVLLATSILWPWLNTWFWMDFMETLFKDWIGSNRAWMEVFFPCMVVGLCVWAVLLALACWAVLRHREQGRHYPIFLLIFAFAQIAA